MFDDDDDFGESGPIYTPPTPFLRGEFRVGDVAVPYYLTSMRVKEAVQYLKLPRDVPFDPDEPVNLDEIWQRELNVERVTDDIVPYLESPEDLKFFNALTTVILPADPERPGRPGKVYADLSGRPPTDGRGTTVDIGPVRLQQNADGSRGVISWDVDMSWPIVVDGQHRLFALKQVVDDEEFPWTEDVRRTQIAVLLLVLDEEVGFRFPGQTHAKTGIIQTCRTLFIDLNKNARRVSTVRQYLMDDRDLSAVSMRGIIAPASGAEKRSVATRVDEDGQIPLGLVDWHSDDVAKFDTGLYVTTVLTLYDIVHQVLGLPPFDPVEYGAADTYLERVNARLGIDGECTIDGNTFSLTHAKARLAQAEDQSVPFTLTHEEYAALGGAFRQGGGTEELGLGQLIVYPLTHLTPYADLIAEYEAKGILTSRFEQWLAHDIRGKEAFVRELMSSLIARRRRTPLPTA